MNSVSILIRCYNEQAHIGRLLKGIQSQRRRPDQIVMVDSGSTDRTLEIAGEFPVEIHHVRPADFSFGRSLNLGLAACRGDLVIIASAHVYPLFDNWVESLTSPFRNERIAITYGRQVAAPGTRYSERRILEGWYSARSDEWQDHPFANNANAAIRRSVWIEQHYDEKLTGLEDLDWAKRCQTNGFGVAYVAEAPVVHAHDESPGQILNRYRREAMAHRQIFREHGMGRIEAVYLASRGILSDYICAARERTLRKVLLDVPRFRAAQFLGTYLGFAAGGDASPELKRRFYYSSTERQNPAASGGTPLSYDDTP